MNSFVMLGPVLLAGLVGAVVAVLLAHRAGIAAPGLASGHPGTGGSGGGPGTGVVAAVAGAIGAVGAAVLLERTPGVAAGVPLVLAPVAFALTHTGVLALVELTRPRATDGCSAPIGATSGPGGAPAPPGTGVARGPAPAVALHRLLVLAAGSTAAVAVTGVLTAAADGRSVVRQISAGGGAGGTALLTADPYPGEVFAVPALAGTAAVLAAVVLVLRAVSARTGAGAGRSPAHLASSHRVLRGATAGLLVLAGVLWAQAGLAVQSLADGPGSIALVSGASAVLLLVAVAHALATAAVLCLPSPGMIAAVRPASHSSSGLAW